MFGIAIVLLGFRTLEWIVSKMKHKVEEMEEEMCLLVNDVDDTVRDQHIGCDDLGAVDEDGAVGHADGHIHAAHGHQRHVAEHAAVADCAVDDVVFQDGSQLLLGHVGEGGADGSESLVVGHEHGDIHEVIKGLDNSG